jgi:alpha-ketoglutarate-dependent taurine dioxygenase
MQVQSGSLLDGLQVRPLGGTFGAEIIGMPIAGDVPQTLFDAFVDLFHRHRVVLVRGLSLDPADLVAFSRRFGTLEIHAQTASTYPSHPEIFCVGNVERDGMKASFARGIEQWHADSSYRAVPSAASLFYGEIVPPEGGDTLFADATAAYATLPLDQRAAIDGLETVHALDTLSEWGRRHNPHRPPLTEQQKADFPPVRHRLVRTHPVTGERSLFLCPAVIREVVGMEASKGLGLIDDLMAHTVQPHLVYRHLWRPGDLVIWDNRAVLHTASLFDHTRYQRLLYRTTVAGA